MPHQIDAIDWFFKNPRSKKYLAADPGLGKTIVAALIANKMEATVFYICPPFLVQNTDSEFLKWAPKINILIYPDSMLDREETLNDIKKNLFYIKNKKSILVIDEAHRFKNEKTNRSVSLYKKIMPLFENVLFLSGTPMPNGRPIELWPLLKASAPDIFGTNKFSYAQKYCGAYKNAFGWDFSGFTNKREFKYRLLQSFMLRQRKNLIDLPPKIEGLLTVGDGMPPVISKIEKKILEKYCVEDLTRAQIHDGELHLATYLRLLGEHKLKYVLPYIHSILEETKESILIFAIHKDTIKNLSEELKKYKPLVITGDVPKKERQEIVDSFQNDNDKRVFLGNIQSCGVGFTLTKASRVIFVEFSWTDGDNQQASDRAHRIGQKGTVNVQYVVLKDSIDAARMEVLLRKRGNAI